MRGKERFDDMTNFMTAISVSSEEDFVGHGRLPLAGLAQDQDFGRAGTLRYS